jgi:hypothetical protein
LNKKKHHICCIEENENEPADKKARRDLAGDIVRKNVLL